MKRRTFIIDKPFQTRFVLLFVGVVIANAIIALVGIYVLYNRSYSLLPDGAAVLTKINTNNIVSLKENKGTYQESIDGDPYIKIKNKPKVYNAFDLYLYPIIAVSLLNSIVLVIFSLLLSFKMAGPLYRLKTELKEYLNGKPLTEIKLRKKDQFSELAGLISKALQRKKSDLNHESKK